jgi:micrococcal nuclease
VQAGNRVGTQTVAGGSNFVPVATIQEHDPCGVCKPDTKQVPTARQTTAEPVRPAVTPNAPANSSWQPGNAVPIQQYPQQQQQPRQEPIPKPEPKAKPEPQWGWAKVKTVIDGDTLILENDMKVRLIGADTPETVHPTKPAAPFGKEASEFTKAVMLLAENWVYLEEDGDKLDRYDRQLAMVWVKIQPYAHEDESMRFLLNDMLIKAGFATAEIQYNYSKEMKDKFRQSEKEAKERKVGIWSQAL